MNAKILVMLGLSSLACASAWALDSSGQRYTKMLASGGPGTIRSAAEDIFNTGYKDQEVLDVAAQVLVDIQTKTLASRDFADTGAWLCKALGISGNGRYRALLQSMAKADINRNTKKWCDKSLDMIPKGAAAGEPFVAGSVNVQDYAEGGPKQVAGASSAKPAPVAAAKTAAAPAAASNKKVDFSLIKEGMSMQEVDELLGPPTNQATYMTGKQFQPFNFGAKDVQRTKYLYKGVGHIVFSLKSAYNGVYRVIEIVPDPNETGYP